MSKRAFTLAEVLIALALLGVVAAFTIPKILSVQTEQRNNAVIKESIAALSEAFHQVKLETGLSATTPNRLLVARLNTFGEAPLGQQTDNFRNSPGAPFSVSSSFDCTSSSGNVNFRCVVMPSGVLFLYQDTTVGGLSQNNAISFHLDPNANRLGDQGLIVFIYSDGTIRTLQNARPNTTWDGGIYGAFTTNALPATDPSWFKW